ncbi:MAG: NAD(P)-binding domain-containing protein, partial [Gaiellaceae bacterium]
MADVVVIGAGPYGLAVAAELRRRSVSFRIFGRVMESWEQRMPEGMLLKSEGFASNIGTCSSVPTLEHFCARHGHPYADTGLPIARGLFADYGSWVQAQVAPELESARVIAIARDEHRFMIELDSGERLRTSQVVVATGLLGHAFVPEQLAHTRACITHSSEHRTFDDFAGREVVVVGAGQSALETAALLLAKAALPVVLARTAELVWNTAPGDRRRAPSRLLRPQSGIGLGWRALITERAPQAFRHLPAATRHSYAFQT